MNELGSVRITTVFPDTNFIACVEASSHETNLATWIRHNEVLVKRQLNELGGILFRGFDMPDDSSFLNLVRTLPFESVDLSQFEEATEREKVATNLYTTTAFPASEMISLHSDYSSSLDICQYLCFFCLTPPEAGGQTPLADNRRIYQRLVHAYRQQFEALGWLLVRYYGTGLGLDWQDTFLTDSRQAVEKHCQQHDVTTHWDGDELRTTQTRTAVIRHPETGEKCWFNHIAFWHVANLHPDIADAMIDAVGQEKLPFQTFFGDGSDIPDSVAHHIRDILLEEKRMFDWQQGDVLLLDNILTSHGREPFSGDRSIRLAAFHKVKRE
ncbi:TauD/TfdA family dioxygenase [Vibrio spartinae]|uniref:Peptide synthase n=1 Tax=Vibrio spartinae TaxID=1918945 RepID=A0A1N6M2S8_9VIBR|nr:TauD/TfdA family dioxygenase [Vibrio spartinae]SIO93753.1 peptide synthase [Vibrio spartinae]